MRKVIALAVSDIHLSHKPPVARSTEDWYEAMGRQLAELKQLQEKHNVPIGCAGDILDKYHQPPELVNWAIKHLPEMFAVPGQHDLKYHSLKDLRKSNFWTLVEAGVVHYVRPRKPVSIGEVRFHGFPWGVPLSPLKNPHDLALDIALVHKYVWKVGCGYEGAPEENRAGKLAYELQGFPLAITGDNHIPFEKSNKVGPLIYNCGGFFRRKMDEKQHKPSVGLVYADGTAERYYLDVSQDKFLDDGEFTKTLDGIGVNSFIEALSQLGDAALDFAEAVKQIMEREKVPEAVKQLVLLALEGVEK